MTLKKDQTYFLGPVLLSGADDSLGKEFQVLKVGTFKHPKYGSFEITPKDLKAFVENFEANARRIETAINYEHGESKAHGTKAAGWIRSLSLKNDGKELWATPEWTPEAFKGLKEGEWKYSSAEILWTYEDAETGKVFNRVLIGAALTNTPFIKGMQRIAAHEQFKEEEEKPMKLSEIESMLLSEHGVNLAELKSKAELVPGLQAQVVELSDKVKSGDTKVKELEAANATLTQKVELSEKAAAEVQLKALIEKGMKEGKLTKAFAEGKFTELAQKNGLKFAEEMLEAMSPVVNVEATKGSEGGAGGEGAKKFKDPSEELVHKATELAAKEKISFSEATDRVFAAEPKLAQRYMAWEGDGAEEAAE